MKPEYCLFPASCTFQPNSTGKGPPLKIPSALRHSIRVYGVEIASFLVWSQCLHYIKHSVSSTPSFFTFSLHWAINERNYCWCLHWIYFSSIHSLHGFLKKAPWPSKLFMGSHTLLLLSTMQHMKQHGHFKCTCHLGKKSWSAVYN